MGVRAVRIYTIHPPAFYDELAAYNRAHPRRPALPRAGRLPARRVVRAARRPLRPGRRPARSRAELARRLGAVHGDLTRRPTPGRACGTWDDRRLRVARCLDHRRRVGPLGVRAHRPARRRPPPYTPGTLLRAATARRHRRPSAGSPGTWTSSRPPRPPAASAPRSRSRTGRPPTRCATRTSRCAWRTWSASTPTTSCPTAAWPGGTFASFHAYPYYPDFQRHEPALQQVDVRRAGRTPTRATCATCKRHYTRMPVLITEFGVPSSLGSAHRGTARPRPGRPHRAAGDGDRRRPAAADRGAGHGRRAAVRAGPTSGSSAPGTPMEHQRPGATGASSGTTRSPTSSGSAWSRPTPARVPDAAREISPATGAGEVRARRRGRVLRPPRRDLP